MTERERFSPEVAVGEIQPHAERLVQVETGLSLM
jgi:hypothetical protein